MTNDFTVPSATPRDTLSRHAYARHCPALGLDFRLPPHSVASLVSAGLYNNRHFLFRRLRRKRSAKWGLLEDLHKNSIKSSSLLISHPKESNRLLESFSVELGKR